MTATCMPGGTNSAHALTHTPGKTMMICRYNGNVNDDWMMENERSFE